MSKWDDMQPYYDRTNFKDDIEVENVFWTFQADDLIKKYNVPFEEIDIFKCIYGESTTWILWDSDGKKRIMATWDRRYHYFRFSIEFNKPGVPRFN